MDKELLCKAQIQNLKIIWRWENSISWEFNIREIDESETVQSIQKASGWRYWEINRNNSWAIKLIF